MSSTESANKSAKATKSSMGTPNSKNVKPCPNCKGPLKSLASRTYECSECGKKYMLAPGTADPPKTDSKQPALDSDKARSGDRSLTSSQSSSSTGTMASVDQSSARKLSLRRRPEPEIIAIDDTDEEEETRSKRKSENGWAQERVKWPKNDENALETSAPRLSRESSASKKSNEESSPSNGKKLDVISNNVAIRNGSEAKILDMMLRDWGVRASDVEEALLTKSKQRSENTKIGIKFMNLSSFTNAHPDTHLDLSETHGLRIKIIDEDHQITVSLGSDDLQYCLIAFHDPVFLVMLKVARKFSELFHEYLAQVGSYPRDESDVRDSRCVFLLNLKKSETAEILVFLQNFFIGLYDPSNSGARKSGRVFSLNLSKTFEFVHRIFANNELAEVKKFYKKYVNQVVSNTLLKYPSPEHSDVATVTLSDLVCLQDGEFLNDNIISFYLKYLQIQMLSLKDQERIHIFNTFFYQRLTQKSSSKTKSEAGLNAAERRHNRVKKWTRNVNIFEKDFLIVPIIKNAHWYLAIICYPYLMEPVYKDQGRVAAEFGEEVDGTPSGSRESSRPRRTPARAIKDGADVALEDGNESFDEADPNDDDLSADLSMLKTEKDKICCKLPTILVFDSLLSGKHQRVIATLREYMECEYSAKFNKPYQVKLYGSKVIAPIQNNYFDCGIYLLQYVESFFAKPLDDFSFPINLRNWFPRKVIDDKRHQIKSLIFSIQEKQSRGHHSSLKSASQSKADALSECEVKNGRKAELFKDLQSLQ